VEPFGNGWYRDGLLSLWGNADIIGTMNFNTFLADAFAHHKAGRLQEAEQAYRQALAINPRHPEALHHFGLLAHQVGRNDAAADLINQAIASATPWVPANYYGNLGWILYQLGRAVEAEQVTREALKREPASSSWHNNLGNALYLQGRITEAAAFWKKSFELDKNAGGALSNYANVLQETGQIQEAMAAHKRAAEIAPQPDAAWDNYLRDVGFLTDLDPLFVKNEHENWAATFLKTIDQKLVRTSHKNEKNKEKTLKVGLISPDFRLHSVTYFIEPLLRQADRNKLQLFCYSNVHAPDDVTARLQTYPATWRNIVGLTDVQAAEQIEKDGIDILIDLGGHTSANRCRILAYKPAPIQMTYLGYPYSTGLKACDYKLTDEISDPVGESDSHYTEKLLRMPISSWCFEPPKFNVPVGPAPHESNGYVTFGSFNTYNKTNDRVLDAWGKIMARVPDARLFIKCHGLGDPQIKAGLMARLKARGIDESRVTIMGREVRTDSHLSLYSKVDIALDTFPYNGTTTTCEALWQGVPVVTREGHMHVARVGETLLMAVGLGDLVAKDIDSYVELVVKLAGDKARISELRRTMRERMLKSPLCDQPAFARRFEDAMRQAWAGYCS